MSAEGKSILVTGASSGIGLAAATALAAEGASLTLLCRNPEKGQTAAAEIESHSGNRPDVLLADLSRLDDVRQAASRFLDSGKPLDVLLNNAGLINRSYRETVDGFEETFAVNHLAPFLLTGLLLPRLLESAGARVVNVASNAHHFCRGLDFADLDSRGRYRTFEVYGRSKLANILFTRELASRLDPARVTVNCLHPGAVATSMGTNNGGLVGKLLPLLLKPFFRSAKKGADTAVWLCQDAALDGVTGEYFFNRKPLEPQPWARDRQAARRLWTVSEQRVAFNYALED